MIVFFKVTYMAMKEPWKVQCTLFMDESNFKCDPVIEQHVLQKIFFFLKVTVTSTCKVRV